MTNSLIACPLCCHPNFSSVDMLRICLLRVTNRPLACPICCEDQMGLDKFTIHLLSHTMEKLQRTEEPLPYYRPNDSVREQSHDVTNGIHSQDPMTDIASNNSSHDQQSPLEIRNDYAERTCDEIPCYTCGSQFRSSELQHIHQQLVHEHQPNQLPRTPSPTVKSTKTSFQCTFCAKRFKMKGSLRLHSRMVHGRIAGGQSLLADDLKKSPRSETECPSSRNAGFVEGEAAVADEKPFPCDVCGKSFTTKYFLRKHKRLHTGEMPYVCEVCSRTFTFQQSYHRHLSYHTDERPHVCPVCGRAFKELSTLHNHERIHSGEKPFKCDICEKSFRQRVSYLVHRRIHTGDMPYECVYCGNKFRYKISLRTHKCTGLPSHSTSDHQTMPPEATTDVTHNLSCAKALDDFVTDSYNRMVLTDPIDFHSANLNRNAEAINCTQNEMIFPANEISEEENNILPAIDELLQCSTLNDAVEELLNETKTYHDMDS